MPRGLDRERILEAATHLLDEQGLEGFSMRRLGQLLDVQAMSLYNHFPNKAALLDAVRDELLASMPLPAPEGAWEAQVREAALAFRELLREHPRSIPLFASRAAVAPRSLAYYAACVAILQRAGFSPVESLYGFQTVFAVVIGHAQFHDTRMAEGEPADATALYAPYPPLHGFAAYDRPAELTFALDVLLAGLRARLPG